MIIVKPSNTNKYKPTIKIINNKIKPYKTIKRVDKLYS